MRVAPKSLDARQKVKECDRAVKEQAFQDAIASPELGGGAVTSVDYTQMSTTSSTCDAALRCQELRSLHFATHAFCSEKLSV